MLFMFVLNVLTYIGCYYAQSSKIFLTSIDLLLEIVLRLFLGAIFFLIICVQEFQFDLHCFKVVVALSINEVMVIGAAQVNPLFTFALSACISWCVIRNEVSEEKKKTRAEELAEEELQKLQTMSEAMPLPGNVRKNPKGKSLKEKFQSLSFPVLKSSLAAFWFFVLVVW